MGDLQNLRIGEGLILPDGRLVRRGVDGTLRLDGDPDATLHPDQERLLLNYQRANGLPATGTMDAMTKAHLKHGKGA